MGRWDLWGVLPCPSAHLTRANTYVFWVRQRLVKSGAGPFLGKDKVAKVILLQRKWFCNFEVVKEACVLPRAEVSAEHMADTTQRLK